MVSFDLPLRDATVDECLRSLIGAIEERGLAQVLEDLRRIDARFADAPQVLPACNVIPGAGASGVCHRVLVAVSRGRGGAHGSNAVLERVARHLAACGASVDGEPPRHEATRFAIVAHDELDAKAFRSRHRPMLEAFQRRGVRVLMLHVDSTNRVAWVEQDLADAAPPPSP